MPYNLLGQQHGLAQEPQVIDGTTYLPVNSVVTAMGGTVDWNQESRILAMRFDQWRATTQDCSTDADVSGTPVTFSAPIRIIDGTAWAPADFWNAAFGYTVDANGTDVTISNPNA
jgi:hypothetical protein